MFGPRLIIAILAVLAKERLTLHLHLLSFFWRAHTTYQQRKNAVGGYLAINYFGYHYSLRDH
jgi:hypothetical protein